MLSAIKAIGACSIILVACYGLLTIVLALLVRIKGLFRAFREYGPRHGGNVFRAVVMDARARPGRFLLVLSIVCAGVRFAEYVMLGLIAMATLAMLLSTVEKWRGRDPEARLTRRLSRPPFVDESRRAGPDSVRASG